MLREAQITQGISTHRASDETEKSLFGTRAFVMFNLDNYQLLTIFVTSSVVILLANEIGRFFGVRELGRGGGDVSTLEGAALGLLALMIGFSFAIALSRFEARRDALLSEANAIGTTALRARLLPAPYAQDALRSLKNYVQFDLISRRTPCRRQNLMPRLVDPMKFRKRFGEMRWQSPPRTPQWFLPEFLFNR